jgi:transposase
LPHRQAGLSPASSPDSSCVELPAFSRQHSQRCREKTDSVGAPGGVAGVQRAIRTRGAELLYLPPYSLDLNPTELLFAKLKALAGLR